MSPIMSTSPSLLMSGDQESSPQADEGLVPMTASAASDQVSPSESTAVGISVGVGVPVDIGETVGC